MIDHIGLRTAQFEHRKKFFIAALAPLGITPAAEYPGSVGFARGGSPAFWLSESAHAPSSMHIAFQALRREAVDAFYAAALAAGAASAAARACVRTTTPTTTPPSSSTWMATTSKPSATKLERRRPRT